MSKSILLLPLAVFTEGDEIAAKLGRQVPRMLGRQIESAVPDVTARFLAARGSSSDGRAGFVASLEIPDTAGFETFARMYGADVILGGKFGLDSKEIFLEVSIYNASTNKTAFVKRYEIYTSYIFDALEEVKLKLLQTLGRMPEEEERIRLFRRPTESWQALLYYLLAEDERYSLQNQMPPAEIFEPLKLYREGLDVDPDFDEARQAMQAYILSALEISDVAPEALPAALSAYGEYLPKEFLAAIEELL